MAVWNAATAMMKYIQGFPPIATYAIGRILITRETRIMSLLDFHRIVRLVIQQRPGTEPLSIT
jgi:hypothetical protein